MVSNSSYQYKNDVILGILALRGLTHFSALQYLAKIDIGVRMNEREIRAKLRKLEDRDLIEIYCESAIITPEGEMYLRRL